jgi:co-chaperonin GroES (HSP10)
MPAAPLSGQLTKYDGNKTDWVSPNDVPDPDPLPQITGWNILIRPIEPEQKIGSVLLPTSFTEDIKYLTNVGQVKAMGPMCYTDPNAKPTDGAYFPNGRYRKPWCKVGDYVVWGRHQGTKIMVKGVSFVLLADELVLMTVENPGDVNPMFGVK